MLTLEEFHQGFMQSVFSNAESRGLMRHEVFFEKVCNALAEDGELSASYTSAECRKRGIDISGYDYDEERKILTLLSCTFFQEESSIETLNQKAVELKFKNSKNFFMKNEKNFYEGLEETSEEYSMCYNINRYITEGKTDKVRFILLTDGKITKNIKKIENEKYGNINFEYRIIDIDYIYKLQMAAFSHEGFEVEMNIPYIKAPTDEKEYISYLTVVPGTKLAEIYEKYGQKLLEQNVRTFLQFRGGVNKGLKDTIENRPTMFFAYNNGITATASRVDTDGNGNITKIYDFQIVNGGQTTSSVYACWKNHKADLSDVFVQMKLSVVMRAEKHDSFVASIAEYANTQNKVNKSDFFSNSPFHKDMKDYSNRIWAPAVKGMQKKTKWFYERVRGEYQNEQTYLTKARKDAFQIENPKNQLIEKTNLSKSEMAWHQEPYTAAQGAQKCFARFAEEITKKIEDDNMSITEDFFKEAVARIIMFRYLEKNIRSSAWYSGGYRSETIAYTLSYLSHLLGTARKHLNFGKVWENQEVSPELGKLLMNIAGKIHSDLLSPPAGESNVNTWARKKSCWLKIKEKNYGIILHEPLLVDTETKKIREKAARKEKKIMKGIDIQILVVGVETEIWSKLASYYSSNKDFSTVTEKELDILRSMAQGRIQVPSESQSRLLYGIYMKAQEELVI